ncbi:MAG: hypothetical protein JRH07_12380 [Deltaproteobacteria bacterium]|nr:hypothetical protein [Deltaproteobacteria bacterium]
MLARGWKKVFFGLTMVAICSLIVFPVFWMTLTALRPESEVFYVHRGTHITLANFWEAWRYPMIQESFINSAVVATLATIFSIQVTVMSGYMLSRFRGAASKTVFVVLYLFRTVPYITWVLPRHSLFTSWASNGTL